MAVVRGCRRLGGVILMDAGSGLNDSLCNWVADGFGQSGLIPCVGVSVRSELEGWLVSV